MTFRVVYYVDLGGTASALLSALDVAPSDAAAGVCEVESSFLPSLNAQLVRVSRDGVGVFVEPTS